MQSDPYPLLVKTLSVLDQTREAHDRLMESWKRTFGRLVPVRQNPIKEATADLEEKTDQLDKAIQFALDAVFDYQRDRYPLHMSSPVAGQVSYTHLRQSPQAAIQLAFTVFEQHLRNVLGAGPELYGQSVIDAAFGKRGALRFGATESEREGLRNLAAGAYAVFRNPRAHRLTEDQEDEAIIVVGLVDLLMQLTLQAEEATPTPE